MVFIRLGGIFVFAETFTAGIIIVAYAFAIPAGFAFNAKMVVAFAHQRALAGGGFVDALCQFNGSRNTGAFHFFHGNIFKLIDISFNNGWMIAQKKPVPPALTGVTRGRCCFFIWMVLSFKGVFKNASKGI